MGIANEKLGVACTEAQTKQRMHGFLHSLQRLLHAWAQPVSRTSELHIAHSRLINQLFTRETNPIRSPESTIKISVLIFSSFFVPFTQGIERKKPHLNRLLLARDRRLRVDFTMGNKIREAPCPEISHPQGPSSNLKLLFTYCV